MCRDGNVFRDENDLIFYVDELIADATKRSEKMDATTNGSSDDESLVLEKMSYRVTQQKLSGD